MTKYALIFTGGMMSTDPAELKAFMEKWGVWYDSMGMGKGLLDYGSAFKMGATVVNSQGIIENAKTTASGYTIVQAETMEEALEYAKSCPLLEHPNTTVEVHEFISM